MDIQEIKEKVAHYLNEIERGAIEELLHDEDAYHLFKVMLERIHRGVKSIYLRDAQYEDRTEIPDCYYEGYDSRNKLQRASSWLPIDFLSYKTILEAYCSSNRLSRHEALEELSHLVSNKYNAFLPYLLEQEEAEPAVLFHVLNNALSASLFTDYYVSFNNLTIILMGNIEGVDFNEETLFDLGEIFNVRKKFYIYNTPSSSGQSWVNFSTGYLDGIDLRCEQSVADFLFNYGMEIHVETQLPFDGLKNRIFGNIFSEGILPVQIILALRGRFLQSELTVPIDLSSGRISIKIGPVDPNPLNKRTVTLLFPIKITPEVFSIKGFSFESIDFK